MHAWADAGGCESERVGRPEQTTRQIQEAVMAWLNGRGLGAVAQVRERTSTHVWENEVSEGHAHKTSFGPRHRRYKASKDLCCKVFLCGYDHGSRTRR